MKGGKPHAVVLYSGMRAGLHPYKGGVVLASLYLSLRQFTRPTNRIQGSGKRRSGVSAPIASVYETHKTLVRSN